MLAIVANAPHDPRDVGFHECRIEVTGVHHGDLELEGDADRDVRIGPVDRAEDCPDLILVGHVDHFIAGGSPQAVIVFHNQFERDVAVFVSAGRVGVLDRQLSPLEHLDAQSLFVAFATRGYRNGRHDGANEPDLDRVHLFGFGDRSARPRVFHLQQEVPLEGLRATERNQIVLGPGIALIELERELGFFIGIDRVDCLEDFRRGERLVQWHVDVLEVRINRFGRSFLFGTRGSRSESDQYEGEEMA